MNKNDFIDIVAEKSGLTKKDSKAALDAVLETRVSTYKGIFIPMRFKSSLNAL